MADSTPEIPRQLLDEPKVADRLGHRMNLPARWKVLKALHRKWTDAPGVLSVDVGYEQYGLLTDVEYFEERQREEDYPFAIEKVAWTRDHTRSKEDRVERLVPDIRDSRFFFPAVCWHGNEKCEWTVESDRIAFRPLQKEPDEWARVTANNEPFRVAKPIKRVDEEKQIYDVTTALMEELSYFPFGTHDDLCDAASRIYDLEPVPPVIHDAVDFEPELFVDS